MKSAVLFLIFNRPDTTRQVFEAIRLAQPPRLYIAADGPRPQRDGEAARCAVTREIASAVDWPCDVTTLFREENLGCKQAVSSAITWFFEHEEEGIILEDDCLPANSFFGFCDELLEHYRADTRIGMIAGTNMGATATSSDSYFFSRLVQIWGWAAWRRSWNFYDKDMNRWPDFKLNNGFVNMGIAKKIINYVSPSFDAVAKDKIDTWDYQWSFSMMSAGMLTVVPDVNLISNIGFGVDATHTKNPLDKLSLPTLNDIKMPLVHPRFVMPNLQYDLSKTKSSSRFNSAIRKIFK